MTFESRRLHYFITVADTGSLGRAAEVLHVAQPARSRQIRLLEEAVGVSRLERSARGMTQTLTLTLARAAYCQSARRLLEDGRAASLHAIRVAGGDIGDLRLGFAEAYAWHPDVLRALRQYRDECPAGVTFTVRP